MPVDDQRTMLTQGNHGDLSLADPSTDFVENVAEIYRLLGFDVRQAIRLRGVSLGLAVLYQRGGVHLPAVVLCQDTQVTEPVCQQLLTYHTMVQRQLPEHQCIVVSAQGFTTESSMRLKAAGLTCVTYGSLLATLAPLERYAAGLLNDYEAWVHQQGREADHFIDPMVRREGDATPALALESLGRWLADAHTAFFILRGEPQVGKSTLLRMFAYHLARRFLDDPVRHPAPVLLTLDDVRQRCPVASLLVTHFSSHGLSEVSIARLMYLVRLGKIVLLCDGFDAMVAQVPREVAQAHFQQLQRLAIAPSKLLLACRPATLAHYATPRTLSGVTVARLQLFNDQQLQDYLSRIRPRTAATDWQLIQQLPDLNILAYQPALLNGLVAALDAHPQHMALNPPWLYHACINNWLEQEAQTIGVGLTRDGLRAVLRALAWRLWQRESFALPRREFEELAAQTLTVWLDDSEPLAPAHLVQTLHTLPLLSGSDEAASVTFRRDTVLSYFLADHVLQSLPDGESIPEGLQTRLLDHTVVTFLAVLDTSDRLCAPLQRILQRTYLPQVSENALQILYWSGRIRAGMGQMLTAPETLRALLTERMPVAAQLRGAQLQDMVLEAAHLREADCTGADLSRAQLQHACLVGASLRQAVLIEAQFAEAIANQADFSQADVTDAVFDHTQLQGSTFLGANVHEAHFANTITQQTVTPAVSSAQAHRLRPVLQQGHAAGIRAVTYSLDGSFVASGDDEGLICLYQASHGHILRVLEGHSGAMRGLACAPHAPLLASGSLDGSVRLWNVERGEAVWTLTGHSAGVLTVAFAPYGTLLASGSADHSVRLWDVTYGTPIQTLQGHEDAVLSVVFSADGMRLISCSADQSLRVWDIATGQAITVTTVSPAWQQVLTIAPDATALAYVGVDASIHLWDIARGVLMRTLSTPQREISALAFTPDSSRLAAGSTDGSVQLWEIARSEPVRLFAAHQREVRALAFAPDGSHLVSCSANRGVRTWDVGRGQPGWSRQGGAARDPDHCVYPHRALIDGGE
ncbi:MAG: NACHT domain-containing protein [Candidatus Tectomicrobia bacterium]|uniref:NACHT domain-containing protein n=1 Tax=Tectimicrobiota bacterium TaxID=2528274 RepID=A0A937W0S3_UNCTE|nr:NACHT domain-containing protein [Candidatus Tectomicrobia bacterium]